MKEIVDQIPAPKIPGFEILERLGEGGMGVVYKARQVALDRWVAVKILRDELAQEAEYIKRFFREARMAGRLRHANIVSALDCGDASGRYFMAMEFVEGQALDRHLRSRGTLPEAEALEIARKVAEALQYAWAHRIIHRDLKPQNVLLTREGVPKVCDFGLCRDVRDLPHLTSLGLIHCTPEYSSPEQARGDKDTDVRADLYSLGVSLYEMLTGVLPFEAADAATMIVRHAMDRPRPPVERNRSISAGANQLVLDLLEKAKEERPAAPAVVIDRIRGLLTQGRGGRQTSTSRTKITRGWRGTSRAGAPKRVGQPAVAAIALGAVAVILIVVGLLNSPRPLTESRRPRVAATPEPPPPAELSADELRRLDLSRFLHAFQPGPDGSVNHWLVLGPLPNPEDRGFDLPVIHQAEGDNPIPGLEFAKSDGSMVRWMRHEIASGQLDFSELEGWRDDAGSSLALAACWVECREDVSVEIRFSSTGGYELLLDRRVLASAQRPKATGEPLRQKIVLGKGWHSILVKAHRLEGKLALQLRIVNSEGERLKSITVWQ
jgi:serine/threonine protein kinase